MKETLNMIDNLTKNIDLELKELLMMDLKRYKAGKGQFTSNNQADIQDNDLLVA